MKCLPPRNKISNHVSMRFNGKFDSIVANITVDRRRSFRNPMAVMTVVCNYGFNIIWMPHEIEGQRPGLVIVVYNGLPPIIVPVITRCRGECRADGR